jgi:Glycopeptide antibiotics resistance protein
MSGVVGAVCNYLGTIGAAMLSALPLAVFIRVIAALRLKKLEMFTTRAHEAGTVLFIMYCAGLAAVTMFCDINLLTADISQWKFNLIPLRFIYESLYGCYSGRPAAFAVNVIGNVAVFVPLGFLVSLLWRGAGWRKAAFVSAAASLCVELCQLPQTSRVTDIDDLILNTLGGLLGYLLYRLIKTETVESFRVKIT